MRASLLHVVERRGARLHLGDNGEGGGVDVAEGEEAEQVHDQVDHRGHGHLGRVPDEVRVLGKGRAGGHVARSVRDDDVLPRARSGLGLGLGPGLGLGLGLGLWLGPGLARE